MKAYIYFSKHQLDLIFHSVNKKKSVFTKTAYRWLFNEDLPEIAVYSTRAPMRT